MPRMSPGRGMDDRELYLEGRRSFLRGEFRECPESDGDLDFWWLGFMMERAFRMMLRDELGKVGQDHHRDILREASRARARDLMACMADPGHGLQPFRHRFERGGWAFTITFSHVRAERIDAQT
jgi:hypothetical protein